MPEPTPSARVLAAIDACVAFSPAHNMINILSVIFLTLGLTACSSGDIIVKSDLGEEVIIKESAVTVLDMDREKAKKSAADRLGIWENYSEERCRAEEEYLQRLCWDAHNNYYLPAKANLAAAASLPEMKYIRYRSINKDVNGDKSASGYKYVLCLPEKATQDQKTQWAEVAARGVPGDREEEKSTNIVVDGTVGSRVSSALCNKYVKS